MFRDMNKLEKAGLIIGGLQCIAGLAVTIYARRQLMKQADAMIQNIENTTPNVEDITNQHLNILEELEKLNKED